MNGAELKTLRGARQLLTKRRVCMVLMHATKLELGAQNNPDFAPGLFDVLNENGPAPDAREEWFEKREERQSRVFDMCARRAVSSCAAMR